mmetsp:Transcript_3356/g.5632  ORF Transcript_3356/g.5632 Transcript_3356/m.5632 type:complete len:94 (+) Transcript_3356:180-461(+)
MKLHLFVSTAAVLFSAFSGSAAAASIEEEYGPAPSTSEKLEHTRVNRNCSHGKKKHVCGKDGKTYRNKCEARRANVKVAYRGRCKKGRNQLFK